MKKHIILLIILLGTLSACKKSWLEIIPQGNQVASTTGDYDKLMNDNKFYGYDVGGFSEAQLMGDEVAAEGNDFASLGADNDYRQFYFTWKDSIYIKPDAQPWALSNHLDQMYQINKIINEVMASSGGDENRKKAIRAEALTTRGWSNFNMANYYCKPYSAATAATDPGFPKITTADITNNNFPRGAVQETYDFIIKDLTDALADIPVRFTIATRMSKPAVEGLLGKVYLFMGRYTDALPLLKAALADVAANGQTSLYNYNQTLGAGGSFLPMDPYNGPVNSPSQLNTDVRESVAFKYFYSGIYVGNATGINGLVLTPQAQALFGPTDLRLKFYSATNKDNSVNTSGRLRRYNLRYSRWCLQLPDLYLLSAECKARTNDLAGAVADVETLRRNRMPAADATVPAAIAGDQNALIKFIIEERIREFAFEGYRWFDMRRLSVDPLYAGSNYTHTIYNSNGTTTVYTLKQPERLVLLFPRYITSLNPNMINNP
jgi:hypothetical protein